MKFNNIAVSVALASAIFFGSTATPYAAAQAEESIQYAQKLSEAFEQAAKAITPSVVNIQATKKARPNPLRRGPGGMRRDPFFEQFKDFFGEDFMERFENMPQDQGDQPGAQGLGTGVVVDAERGFILTNNHVIGDADSIEVRLTDGKRIKAELVGKDERSDLAVVKIKAPGLVAAKLGDSDALKIGEWVVAAGNPFGLDNTITAGIVSAKGRSIMGGGQYEDFIQTDAAINPGNSGGPLVNLNGEVVGINTAIFSRSGGYMGIGFAIPANMAKNVMESLINNGKVVRGWLGVGIQNLSEDLAKSFNHSGTDGALVGHVEVDGPAGKAGLKQGDIIVTLNGDKLKDINQLRNRIAGFKPGTEVELEYIRDGKTRSVSIKVGELPANLSGGDKQSPDAQQEEDSGPSIGVGVEDLTPQIAKRIGTTRKVGAVIAAVKPNSVAARSGLAPMDIVVSMDGKPIKSANDLKIALKGIDLAKGARLVVESQGMERFVFLRDEDKE
jgi:serine protease Do